MARKNFKNIFSFSLLILTLMGGAVLLFTACDSPMGLGKPIDFEPPILTLDTIPTPFYVKSNTIIGGTVTDNIGVKEVILRDSVTQSVVKTSTMPDGRATLSGNRWEMKLDFDESRNGEKLTLDIVAFDRMNNSGPHPSNCLCGCGGYGTSIRTIIIIVDMGPPITNDMVMKRSDTRDAFFEPLNCGLPACRFCHPLPNVTSSNPNYCLKGLLSDDRRHDRISNVNRFQNGFFHVIADITEEQTRIDTLTLNIYDASEDKINIPLLKLKREADSSDYNPKWLVSEADILAAGEKLWPGYKDDYYNNHKEYIYRVATELTDMGKNPGEYGNSKLEEEGYFVLSCDADRPRGNLDPIVGTTIDRGGVIPVEFFDDDTLDWAYAGLLTREQWYGEALIADGVYILDGDGSAFSEERTNAEKLDWLLARLKGGQTVYNWKFDRYKDNLSINESEPVKELIENKSLDEKTIYLQTGNNDSDYGSFILFSLVGDKKIAPHTNTGSVDTDRPRSYGRSWEIEVIDANAPLIVLDVENGCPEENTFPKLTNGEFFTLKGYTLRENGNGLNGVITLRMAWIPFGKPNGADSYISAVQAALSAPDYPKNLKDGSITIKVLNKITGLYNDVTYNLGGIQHWDFDYSEFDNATLQYNYKSGEDEQIGVNYFRRQPFERRFSVLGTPDDNVDKGRDYTADWKDFHYGCTPGSCEPLDGSSPVCRENENKLFVIFAECNMGHKVYRQMRLLSNKTPPSLSVYDITGKILDNRMSEVGAAIPNIQTSFGGQVSTAYDTALREFNKRQDVYTLLRSVSKNVLNQFLLYDYEKAIPFQMYTRDTILKLWANATPNGDLSVKTIRMKDITFDTVCTCPENVGNEEAQKSCEKCAKQVGSEYNKADNALTFIEYYPDEAQRVFLFEAEDSLGNIARMQRTIAATNAAKLEKITTQTLDGTYGSRDEIILQADFSGLIRVEGTVRPELNIRYPIRNPSTGVIEYQISSLPAYIDTPGENLSGKETLFLRFSFPVPEGAYPTQPGGGTGYLETMFGYDGAGGINMGGTTTGPESERTDRPIRTRGSRIIDVNRDKHAFIPGYTIDNVGMPNWITKAGSLQNDTDGKKIVLDGIRPVIMNVLIGGKTSTVNGTYNDFYFKNGETIEVTITADKPILNSQIPHLPFVVTNLNGNSNTTNSTHLVYTRQGSNANQLVFSLPTANVATDGQITSITLYTTTTTGEITDLYNNPIASAVTTANTAGNLLHSSLNTNSSRTDRIYIKKVLPTRPVVTLTNTTPSLNVQLQSAATTYNHGITMTISSSAAALPYRNWENVIEYTLDGGLKWEPYTAGTPVSDIANGTYNIRARYKDLAGNEGYQSHRCTVTANVHSDICQDTRNYSCAGTIQINADFPRLNAITAVQSTGWFTANAGQNTLTFNLAFEDQVRVLTQNQVTITLRNRNTANAGDAVTAPAVIQLTAATGQTTNRTSIRFDWPNITGKEMPDGLYVSEVVLTGLRDSFGNAGGSGTATYTGVPQTGTASAIQINNTTPNHTCPNLVAGYRVDAINPTVQSRTPANTTVSDSANGNNTSIKLEFSEPVMKGSGTITIRPRGNFAIPPVFEDKGYWLGTDGTRYNVPTANSTYIKSLYDVYNEPTLTAAERNYLTEGTTTSTTQSPPFSALDSTNPSMSRLRLNERTGQSVGPYKMLTQGLIEGPGYHGNYTQAGNTTDGTQANAPNPAGTFMVPDTATKWVLDYQYTIATTTTDSAVARIRAVLNKAKFRWQEIDVISTSLSADNKTVTVTLNEPLLKGLQWDVHYPEGLFTDLAGNPAAGSSGANNAQGNMEAVYWFWSSGVQAPVIRVNRRSSDMRTSNWHSASNRTYAVPGDTANWNASIAVTDDNGWGIGNFNTVHYRVESESPGATINARTLQGSANAATATGRNHQGAVTAAWTGNVQATALNADATLISNMAWDAANANTAGTWVLSNVIRRSRNTTNQTYTVNTKNGTPESRTSTGAFGLFRSFNRDAVIGDLTDANTSAATLTNGQGILNFGALEANKSYIRATATLTGQGTVTGYEGIFRTVIALRYDADRASQFQLVEGSNIKNGMPSIAGFPVRDAEETGDNRFVKAFYRNSARQFYWVSTEIVSEWYFLRWGGGGNSGTHMSEGEANNYLMVGYGDMTYGNGVNCSGESAGN